MSEATARRPVVFVKYFDKGSTVLGAHQMETALREAGVKSRTIYASQLGDVSDSILVFIKKGQVHHLLGARARGNLLVLDVQDTLCFKRRLKNRWLYHGIIFRSQRPMDDYGNGSALPTKIYLQWNPNYRPNRVGDQEFRLAYFGDPRSFGHWGQLDGVPCIPEQRFFEEAPNYNCHISIRRAPREVLFKPTCKVSTAAACHANLITTRDAASVEVLGSDYPYYTEPDAASVRQAIERARASFGGAAWRAGLERMRAVEESHALGNIVGRYLAFFARLDPAGFEVAAPPAAPIEAPVEAPVQAPAEAVAGQAAER